MEIIRFQKTILFKVKFPFCFFSNQRMFAKEKDDQPDLTKSILFHGVTYLGSASTNAPRSEEDLHR